ncbi:MAG: hypothetical protein U5L96_08945 [Owenweeksia sp.]|nr:hypothetical protein [Owenweeksia sp.]
MAAVAHASYHEGQMVEVKYGPMCGSQGQVLRQKKHKLVLRIEQLGLEPGGRAAQKSPGA